MPDSRSSYVISDFLLYEKIPELKEQVTQMPHVDLPDYESVDINTIHSEGYPPKSNFSIELIQSKNSLLIC